MKIGLFLMNQKGLSVLEALLDAFGASTIAYVCGARDPAVKKDFFDEISALCRKHQIDFRTRGDELPPLGGFLFAVGWRWLITSSDRLIVFHDSKLPRYRGFAPLISQLIQGEPALSVSALYAAEEYDRGELIGQKSIPVKHPMRIADAIERISGAYAELAIEVIGMLRDGVTPPSTPQDEAQASYSLWRDDDDYLIDWSEDAERLERFVKAVGQPYQGAATFLQGRKARITDAVAEPEVRIENRAPGKVIFLRKGMPTVVCGRGLLRILEMRDAETGASLLPLKKLRVRFGTP